MSDTDPVALCPKLLRERFAAIFGQDRRAALIGVPENQNCGQYANWLGAVRLLAEMAVEVVYASSWSTFDRDLLSRRIGNGVIFLAGGLFVADPTASRVCDVIVGFRNRIVFLPEAPAYGVSRGIVAALANHPDVVILARETVARQRLETALSENRRIELAPPAGFVLGLQERRTGPQYDIVWIARTGRRDSSVESAARLSSQSAEKLDLPEFPDGIGLDAVVRQRPPTVMLTDWSSLVFRSQEARLAINGLEAETRAQAYMDRGMYIVSLGHVVITDRAGAHMFCLLLRIPHIFVDDGSGANRALFESWSKPAGFCRFADRPAKAWSLARNMLREIKGEE
jgi:exopolysaccharide biosynthesis predicted pyruvyltransferase EpsI